MTISMPSGIEFRSCNFSLKSNTQIFTSPFNGATQRQEFPGARWMATYTLVPKKRADIAAIQAFLAKLRGASNTFYGYDPYGLTPRGTAGGTPLVNGADQVGGTLITDGWSAGATLLTGDYFTVNSELKMVTDDATADGSGNMTINFEPVLRNSPADNAPLTTTSPTCIMRLLDDDQTGWDMNESGFYDITFSAVETFY